MLLHFVRIKRLLRNLRNGQFDLLSRFSSPLPRSFLLSSPDLGMCHLMTSLLAMRVQRPSYSCAKVLEFFCDS